MSKPNSFDVLREMSARNLNIKMSIEFVAAQKTKLGGEITMGVDGETIYDLLGNKPLILALFVIDRNQFEALRAEMEEKEKA